MKDLGFLLRYGQFHRGGVSVEIRGAQLVSSLPKQQLSTLANQIRVAYSKRVLGRVASVTGWNVKSAGQNAYVMERR